MNHLFRYQDNDILILNKELIPDKTFSGDVLFRGQDLARALGYSNHRDALLKHVDTTDKVKIKNSDIRHDTIKVNNAGENFITESGMYALVLGSTLESAKEFKLWVTSEVLPQIRKTGSYVKKETELNISTLIQQQLDIVIDARLEEKIKSFKVSEVNELMSLYRAYGLTKKEARQLAVKTLRLKSNPDVIINGYLQDEREEDIRRCYGQVKAYVKELTKIGYSHQDAWNAYAQETLLKTGYDLVKARGVIRAKGKKTANYIDAARECGVLKDSVTIIKRFANRKVKQANKANA